MNYLEQVNVFMNQFEQTVPSKRDYSNWKLRIALLQEELNELKTACEEHNEVEILDALCDLQYVLSGAVLAFGLESVFNEAFAEVQRSNLSKSCDSYEEALQTQQSYLDKGIPTYIKQVQNKWNIYRRSDNKVLKANSYFPANLTQFIK